MAGTTLELMDLLEPDALGCSIARQFMEWKTLRNNREQEWKEVRQYVYATDTTQTSNSALPWKNKTTIPKICQISDNLYANYSAALFPKRKWVDWEGDTSSDESAQKREAIVQYMQWVVDRSDFQSVMQSAILDYIHYGLPFLTVDWCDERVTDPETGEEKMGYVGPVLKRLNPLDVVMNPLAPSFKQSPKIVRSYITLGEVKEILERETTDDNAEEMEQIYTYLLKIRTGAATTGAGDNSVKDTYFQMDGFTSFQAYLQSNYVEVLTFYGDMFDVQNNVFYKNHVITVIDRHKVVGKKLNPSYFGTAPIYSTQWRKRQDNLWGMGPLDNLLGMQYRIDHLENMKADVYDLVVFPPLKIKGHVTDFNWAPMERIYIGDDGDVDMLSPDVNALQVNFEIKNLEDKMEEMAGAPKEAMGFRTPGEKTAYEVQRMENASSRIFYNKINQFEQEIVEPAMNAMLELARRKLDGTTTIRILDDNNSFVKFRELSAADLTGQGRLRPVAARHFAERAELVQNITSFMGSAIGADPDVRRHFSSWQLAKMLEEVLDLGQYNLVSENVRIAENAEAQTMANSTQEQSVNESLTPSGLTPEDAQNSFTGAPNGA
jgi:hypothetical protein